MRRVADHLDISELERRFKPIFGDRLIISSNHDAQNGLSHFRDLIEKN